MEDLHEPHTINMSCAGAGPRAHNRVWSRVKALVNTGTRITLVFGLGQWLVNFFFPLTIYIYIYIYGHEL